MPRQARNISDTHVYHAILRGVNKQQIFECSEDYEHFVRILQRQCGLPVETRPSKVRNYGLPVTPYHTYDDVSPFVDMGVGEVSRHCYIYAWCLMGNHVHLLIKENDEPIGDVMKRISSSYVYYYNHKYDRIGHLFQERFKSQTCDSWDYFLTLLRYIHQNPLKAHLVNNLMDYEWSSWREYNGKHHQPFSSVDTVLGRITIEELAELVNTPLKASAERDLIDADVQPRSRDGFTDEEAWQILTSFCGATNATEFQILPRPQQKHVLYMAHEEGLGPRTLSRLTGVTYSVVQKATSAANECKRHHSQMVYETTPEDEEYMTYLSPDEFVKYPEF